MTHYFQASRQQHARCEAQTAIAFQLKGKEFFEFMSQLEHLLGLMDQFASCAWGCHEHEHAIEYLAGRAVSYSRASWRLIEVGHYDEAISLIRTIMEIGNLCWLFFIQKDALREWIDAPNTTRMRDFQPGRVRKRILDLGAPLPHGRDEYARLCEVGVHPNPNIAPQTHNPESVPTLGGRFQETGLSTSVATLGWALASVAGPSAKLALLEQSRAEEIVNASIELVEMLPDLSEVREVLDSSNELLELAKARKDRDPFAS
jgi:hypothetical protein